jgi:hypothetical protein
MLSIIPDGRDYVNEQNLIRMLGIRKAFPGVVANEVVLEMHQP